MQKELETLMQNIKDDYTRWTSRNGTRELTDINRRMIAEFNEGIGYTEGRKYIKVTKQNNGSVWGFVVATDSDKKFKKGDILMAAGFNNPARNKARGNVFEDYSIAWTGPHYLV